MRTRNLERGKRKWEIGNWKFANESGCYYGPAQPDFLEGVTPRKCGVRLYIVSFSQQNLSEVEMQE